MTFTNAPVTRLLVLGLVSASIGASMLDVKHYFYISIDTHLWKYRQFWRLLAYQLCYTNSTEVLFAAMSLYNLRVVERMWGSRKYAVSNTNFAVDSNDTTNSNSSTVLPRRVVTLHSRYPSHDHGRVTAALRRVLQLHACWPNSHRLCHSRPIPHNGSSRVQIPSGYVTKHTSKRRIRCDFVR